MSSVTHGMAKSPTHIVWMAMRARCNQKNHKYYGNYGGRGIRVCSEWDSFERFHADMGTRPEGTSIDRIDSDLGYYKENCKWATRTEQNRNTSQNRNITYNGSTKCLAEWCELLNLKYARTYMRLFRLNWTVDRSFTL